VQELALLGVVLLSINWLKATCCHFLTQRCFMVNVAHVSNITQQLLAVEWLCSLFTAVHLQIGMPALVGL
jgi:hypothetical protein